MEELKMLVSIVVLLIGLLILGAGIYYRARTKGDAESQRIYTVTAVAGAVIAAAAAICLIV